MPFSFGSRLSVRASECRSLYSGYQLFQCLTGILCSHEVLAYEKTTEARLA